MGRPLIHPKINCARCNTTFRGSGRSQKFCSLHCKKQDTQERLTRVCAHCGNSFVDVHASRRNITCSKECRIAFFVLERSPSWKNGRYVHPGDGYARVSVRGSRIQRLEHRVVVESVLGRPLLRSETITHLNGIKDDNRPSNLFLYGSYGEFKKDFRDGIRPNRSNIDPLTYMQASERGSAIDRQQAKIRERNRPEPPVGPWHNGRQKFAVNGKKRGAPDTHSVNDAVRKLLRQP